MKQPSLFRHVISILATVFGAALVFALTLLMNELGQPGGQRDDLSTTGFKVEHRPKKRIQKKARSRPRKTSRRRATAPVPVPNLSSALGGVNLDVPTFDESELLTGTDQSLLGDASKQLVMTEDTVDRKPRPTRRVPPGYPDKARRRGITGFVTMKLLISSEGSVEWVRVLEAQPRGVFEDVALASVRQWRYSPATYHGDPVAMEATQTLRFRVN